MASPDHRNKRSPTYRFSKQNRQSSETSSEHSDLSFVGNPHLVRRTSSLQDLSGPITTQQKSTGPSRDMESFPESFGARQDLRGRSKARRASIEGRVEASDLVCERVRENMTGYKALFEDRKKMERAKEFEVHVRNHWT